MLKYRIHDDTLQIAMLDTVAIMQRVQQGGLKARETDASTYLFEGSPAQLRDLLRRPELRQLAQRVAAHFFIPPLEEPEVARYIEHRLAVAGRSEALFTPEAVTRIAQLSRGIPRSINILCDTALVYGYSAEREPIDAELIEEVGRIIGEETRVKVKFRLRGKGLHGKQKGKREPGKDASRSRRAAPRTQAVRSIFQM